jgi:hypothetical protein
LALFILGIPVVVIYILTLKDQKLRILMTNINKFQKGDMYLMHVRYFLELIDKKDTDRNARVFLKGYIITYEESCTLKDCPLKKYIYSLEKGMETNVFLLQHAETLFQNGISKFPNCIPLRLAYSLFLIEKLNKKQNSLLELMNADKYHPKFEEKFMIYRYKKLTEELSIDNENTSEENLDVVSNITYKNHLNQCNNKIFNLILIYS